MLARPRGGSWTELALFTDRDRGHWLESAELDGRLVLLFRLSPSP